MKLLFFQWHSFMNPGIEKALKKLNIEYDTFFYQWKDWEEDAYFLEQFEAKIKGGTYNMVFSVNFAPLTAEICERFGIPYVSWVYDSPVHIKNLETMKRSCSRIYFFDRGQAQEYKKQGIPADYMPLAADTELFGKAVRTVPEGTYGIDISMVGQLYQTEYAHFTAPLSGYRRGYLEGIINSQLQVSGGYLIPDLITAELLDEMNREYEKVSKDGFLMGSRELEFLLACETTGRERYLALSLLSGHFQTALYSDDTDSRLKNVHFRGYADYDTKMPAVFAQSRVNLNISLKTIRTGIPLRVIDCMGCGGFVISSFTEEIMEYFALGEECAVYENLEDLYAKTAYYLKHEEERKRIAAAGLEKIKRDFTFEERLSRMLSAR